MLEQLKLDILKCEQTMAYRMSIGDDGTAHDAGAAYHKLCAFYKALTGEEIRPSV